MTSLLDSPLCPFLVAGVIAWILWLLWLGAESARFREYVHDWCLRKVDEDELALTDAGVEAMTDYICKKMEGRPDRWECELYISPSAYRRIANEYSKRKEW